MLSLCCAPRPPYEPGAAPAAASSPRRRDMFGAGPQEWCPSARLPWWTVRGGPAQSAPQSVSSRPRRTFQTQGSIWTGRGRPSATARSGAPLRASAKRSRPSGAKRSRRRAAPLVEKPIKEALHATVELGVKGAPSGVVPALGLAEGRRAELGERAAQELRARREREVAAVEPGGAARRAARAPPPFERSADAGGRTPSGSRASTESSRLRRSRAAGRATRSGRCGRRCRRGGPRRTGSCRRRGAS